MSESIDEIIKGLNYFGYNISIENREEKSNNGVRFTQLKIPSRELIVTIYENEKKGNSVVGGRASTYEKAILKEIVEKLKWNSFENRILEKEILYLISTKCESNVHDFKEKWGNASKTSLLHDILCLANNKRNEPAYLIMGVSDNFHLCGLEESIDQDEIYSWFGKLDCFASNEKPELKIHPLIIAEKKIDVLEITPDDRVPYFLDKEYSSKGGKPIQPYRIYTRNGDTNTPINVQANKKQIEELWSIRFM